MVDKKPATSHLLDEEYSVTIKPRRILKGFVLILLLVGVFYLGRWSVDVSPVETTADLTEETSSSSFSLTGFITSILPDLSPSDDKEKDNPSTEAPAEENNADIEDSTENESVEVSDTSTSGANQPSSTPPTPEPAENSSSGQEETVVTSYSKVALALNDVTKDWKGTWGKITYLDYTIKNNEDGTIKPSYLTMEVEGYDDYEKKVPLPLSSKTIESGKSQTGNAAVPQGFSYSELTTGDLKTVDITLSLYDSSDKLMTTYKRSVNLQGQ